MIKFLGYALAYSLIIFSLLLVIAWIKVIIQFIF